MHFLLVKDNWRARTLSRSWAVVTVIFVKPNLLEVQADEGIGLAKDGTEWTLLPSRIRVVDSNGLEIAPTKDRPFWVSLQTFNPYHLVTAAPESVFSF